MPTDHGPELEGLRKRLADAKEFLYHLAGKERELAGLREQASAPNLWDEPERARRVMRRLAAVEGDLETVAGLQGQLEDLETLNLLALEEDDDSVAAELTQGLASLAAAVEDLEVLALLGGEFDDRDAIVTIHPRARGARVPGLGPRCCSARRHARPLGRAARVQGDRQRLPGG